MMKPFTLKTMPCRTALVWMLLCLLPLFAGEPAPRPLGGQIIPLVLDTQTLRDFEIYQGDTAVFEVTLHPAFEDQTALYQSREPLFWFGDTAMVLIGATGQTPPRSLLDEQDLGADLVLDGQTLPGSPFYLSPSRHWVPRHLPYNQLARALFEVLNQVPEVGRSTLETANRVAAYLSQTPAPVAAKMDGPGVTAPEPGSTLAAGPVTFEWDTAGDQITAWWLYVGDTPGAYDRFNSGLLPGDTLSQTVLNLPDNGSQIHVRLWFRQAAAWAYQDTVFTASTAPSNQTPWSENGADVYYQGGNVGIGTADPTVALDVAGTVKADAMVLNGQTITSWPQGDSAWSQGAGGAIHHSSGNVGIGVETPTTALDVAGTVTAQRFEGDGSGLTGLAVDRVAVPVAHTPAFLTGGVNAETNYLNWASLSSGRFRITIDGVTHDVDVNFSSGVNSMADVATRIQTTLRAVTGGLETVNWEGDHFVFASGNTTSESSITTATTHGSGIGIDISGAGSGGWLDCASSSGVVTATVLNPAFYQGQLVALDGNGAVDTRLMPADLQAANTFFGGTSITSDQANTLINGGDASALHHHDSLTNVHIGVGYFDPFVSGASFVIGHNLGHVPKIIRIKWSATRDVYGEGLYNGSYAQLYRYDTGSAYAFNRSTSNIIFVDGEDNNYLDWSAVISEANESSFTITVDLFRYRKPVQLMWEVQ